MTVASDEFSIWPYLEKVLAAEDKPLFEEACSAAASGAFRLAYVGIWLSCAESLKRRFREIAPRDEKAKTAINNVDQMESQHKAVDSYLLHQAKEYGFISDLDFFRLQHIYGRRCLYGHPYEQAPSQEDLVSAASTVVDAVLSRPVKVRHSYLSEEVRRLIEEPDFLEDHEGAAASHAREVYPAVDDALHLWFLQQLWQAAEALSDKPSQARIVRRAVWFSAAYVLQATDLLRDRWQLQRDVLKYPVVCSMALADLTVYAALDDHTRGIVFQKLLGAATSRPESVARARALSDADLLTGRQREGLGEAIDEVPVWGLPETGIPLCEWAGRLLSALDDEDQGVQGSSIRAVRSVSIDQLAALPADSQEAIGRGVVKSAEGGCDEAASLVAFIADARTAWPVHFLMGVVRECFVDWAGRIDYKTNCAKDALLGLRAVPGRVCSGIVSGVVSAIAAGEIKDRSHFRWAKPGMLAALDAAVEAAHELRDLLRPLREAIEASRSGSVAEELELPPDEEIFGDL